MGKSAKMYKRPSKAGALSSYRQNRFQTFADGSPTFIARRKGWVLVPSIASVGPG